MQVQRSSRDPDELRGHLERWLADQLGTEAAPRVVDLAGTSANGMSSETVVFSAEWAEGDTRTLRPLVARLAPNTSDIPVFPSYDLRRQFEVMRLVGTRTHVEVPTVWWYEPDPAALGAPFFVMERVEGLVPPDVMPYNFGDSWLYDAGPDQQRHLQDATVAAIAALHDLPLDGGITKLLAPDAPGDTPLARHLAHTRAWYEWAVEGGPRSELLDEGFAWLDRHFPTHEGPAVLSWGDARIGNVIYREFEVAAVLDWEMVGIGPRELDVAWLINAHDVFEHIAAQLGLGGMPQFLNAADVAATYLDVSGHRLDDLEWYLTYAAVQFGIVFLRTGQRQLHFGEIERPANVDDLFHHKDLLAAKLRG